MSSTWGAEGYSKVWLNGPNDWIYRHLHHAERRMERLVRASRATRPRATARALDQAARELLLAQSSDWAFIVTNATSVPYAVKRVREHLTSSISWPTRSRAAGWISGAGGASCASATRSFPGSTTGYLTPRFAAAPGF